MPAVISLAGDWDIFGREELRRRLRAAHFPDPCIVDLTDFHCGDVSFVNELVRMAKVRQAQGRQAALLVVHEKDALIRRVLELSRLVDIWPMYESVEAAVAAANAGASVRA
jgi:anti-anti-sigma regulatory factor